MKKFRRKWRRLSMYKKSLIIMTTILIALGLVFLGYVYNSMIIYERNLIDNYVIYIAQNGYLNKDIDDAFTVSKYEKSNKSIKDGLKEFYKSDNLKVKKNVKESTDDIYVYDLYNDQALISQVSLRCKKKYKRMAILTIYEWEIADYKNYLENGIYNYDITIPSSYKLYINDEEVSSSDATKESDVKDLDKLTEYIEICKSREYVIDKLINKPTIKIKDENNQEVSYEIKDNKIVINKPFIVVDTLEEAKKYIKDDFDIMNIAHTYSLFLSDDLTGPYHGFNIVNEFLIKDSYMYKMAYNWSRSIDITFVSNHRLKNPTFTNESLSNFVIYNDNAFSVEVYLDKNMIVSGKDLVDTMHDRLYFIYYNGSYKLVNMSAITER